MPRNFFPSFITIVYSSEINCKITTLYPFQVHLVVARAGFPKHQKSVIWFIDFPYRILKREFHWRSYGQYDNFSKTRKIIVGIHLNFTGVDTQGLEKIVLSGRFCHQFSVIGV